MMKKNFAGVVIFLLLALCIQSYAQPKKRLTYDQLPATVKQKIQQVRPGLNTNFVQIKEERKDDKTRYEITYFEDGIDHKIQVYADGRLKEIEESVSYYPLLESERNIALSDTASLNEDLVGLVLKKDKTEVEEQIRVLNSHLPSLKSLLLPEKYAHVETLVRHMTEVSQQYRWTEVALDAVEVYRALVTSLDKGTLVVPVEVSLLDYGGFKLSALVAATPPDWEQMARVVDEIKQWWTSLLPLVYDKGLHDVMTTLLEGMEGALSGKQVSQLQFAAQMDLNLVDLVEQYFTNSYKRRITPAQALTIAKKRYGGIPVGLEVKVIHTGESRFPRTGYKILLVQEERSFLLDLSLTGDFIQKKSPDGDDEDRIRRAYSSFKRSKEKLEQVLAALTPEQIQVFQSAFYHKDGINIMNK